MTAGSIQRRLMALEAQASTVERFDPIHPVNKLLDVLVAYHLGGMSETESIAAGMARGLGYDSAADLRGALAAGKGTPKSAELDARWQDALERLFARKGAVHGCEIETFRTTLEALKNDMPDEFQKHPFILPQDEIDRAINDMFL